VSLDDYLRAEYFVASEYHWTLDYIRSIPLEEYYGLQMILKEKYSDKPSRKARMMPRDRAVIDRLKNMK